MTFFMLAFFSFLEHLCEFVVYVWLCLRIVIDGTESCNDHPLIQNVK
jgi:hypothetical protein